MLRALLMWNADRRAWNREHRRAWAGSTEPTASGLTRFQLMCEAAIVEALRDSGVGHIDRAVVGEGEPSLRVRLTGTDWTLWIHSNAAAVMYQKATLVRIKGREVKTPADFIALFVNSTLYSVWH